MQILLMKEKALLIFKDEDFATGWVAGSRRTTMACGYLLREWKVFRFLRNTGCLHS